jgi:hypothetical protein
MKMGLFPLNYVVWCRSASTFGLFYLRMCEIGRNSTFGVVSNVINELHELNFLKGESFNQITSFGPIF